MYLFSLGYIDNLWDNNIALGGPSAIIYHFNPLRFNPGKTGIFFTPRKRSTRAKPGFFLPPGNVQPGQNRDFTDPAEGLPFDAQKPYEGW